MKEWQSQAHVKWECKYHVVIVPKYRKKAIYGKLHHEIGQMFQQLCRLSSRRTDSPSATAIRRQRI